MKKIIHLSDIHVGYKDFESRFHRIADKLILDKANEANDYVILITGDLVNDANQLHLFEQVKNVLDKLKLAGFENILVVPGNHDYGTGNFGKKKFLKVFQEHFYGALCQYPKLDIIEGCAFIGLDSMADELHWYDKSWAQGELGNDQRERLDSLLRRDDVVSCNKRVIYLHHHPFGSLFLHRLKDSNKLERLVKGVISSGVSIDALLFGHRHKGNEHNGTWGIPRCYDAGSVTLKERGRQLKEISWFKVQSATRLIDLTCEDPSSDTVLDLVKF